MIDIYNNGYVFFTLSFASLASVIYLYFSYSSAFRALISERINYVGGKLLDNQTFVKGFQHKNNFRTYYSGSRWRNKISDILYLILLCFDRGFCSVMFAAFVSFMFESAIEIQKIGYQLNIVLLFVVVAVFQKIFISIAIALCLYFTGRLPGEVRYQRKFTGEW